MLGKKCPLYCSLASPTLRPYSSIHDPDYPLSQLLACTQAGQPTPRWLHWQADSALLHHTSCFAITWDHNLVTAACKSTLATIQPSQCPVPPTRKHCWQISLSRGKCTLFLHTTNRWWELSYIYRESWGMGWCDTLGKIQTEWPNQENY